MEKATPQKIYLKNYQKPDYIIETVFLTVDLDDTKTQVTSVLKIKRMIPTTSPLVLNGKELILKSVALDKKGLTRDQYFIDQESLTIKNPPSEFTLTIENEINPKSNTCLEGLYKSGDIFCTQNEAEGFRRITYYLDRPDVMAKFTCKIIADKKSYPVLLSNGNPIDQGTLGEKKHYRTWEDPFPKPCYLFALVAGDLGLVTDRYVTASKREIDLRIYCDKGNESKCFHAIESLKKSMKWDEETFGLEYDLDIYMIVAVDSFNMGAMENKGLNIFNSSCVLADSETAVDNDFLSIEGIIAHEYFHNWTGNRVTCRDWFQLTLKEGLTVFRDQEFSADMNSRFANRIDTVSSLRLYQFPEDAGPRTHPIRPESYIEISNFYTATVYQKGSEVIRMLYTLLGKTGFRRGMDKYFELYDGKAVTTDDFLYAMSVANNNYDVSQFKNWYSQAGTPKVGVETEYDSTTKQFKLTLEQSCLPTPESRSKKPFVIPLNMGLVSSKGEDIVFKTLVLKQEKEEFLFENITEPPVLSLNREFSAPVELDFSQSFEELAFLLASDNDPFNRYEAAQRLGQRSIHHLIKEKQNNRSSGLDLQYIKTWGKILNDSSLDAFMQSRCLSLPAQGRIHQEQNPIDIESTHIVRLFVEKTLAQHHREALLALYQELKGSQKDYSIDSKAIGQRKLKNICLHYLSVLDENEGLNLCHQQFLSADNMTDKMAALTCFANSNWKKREEVLRQFYEQWKHNPLVIQKWLVLQSLSRRPDTLERVLILEKDPVYNNQNPNFFRCLVGGFASNSIHFHHRSGSGYKFIADQIIFMNQVNPSLAARIASAFQQYKKLPEYLRQHMHKELQRILDNKPSKDVYEVVSNILADTPAQNR